LLKLVAECRSQWIAVLRILDALAYYRIIYIEHQSQQLFDRLRRCCRSGFRPIHALVEGEDPSDGDDTVAGANIYPASVRNRARITNNKVGAQIGELEPILQATPSVVVVRSDGSVVQAWRGRLDSKQESELLAVIAKA